MKTNGYWYLVFSGVIALVGSIVMLAKGDFLLGIGLLVLITPGAIAMWVKRDDWGRD